jgi:hypothetical protein
MPFVLVADGIITQEQYEETVRRIAGKDRMESTADWPVQGVLCHTAGQGPTGFRVVDVWESRESLESFGATLIPILREMGVEEDPEIYEAHTYVSA